MIATKETILDEIRRLTQEGGGIAPGIEKFAAETGISWSTLRGKYWSKWSDAVAEAGFEPRRMNIKKSSDFVLETYAAVCRHYGKVPSWSEVVLYLNQHPGSISQNAMFRHFGSKSKLDQAFAAYVRSTEAAHDLLPMLRDEESAGNMAKQEQQQSTSRQDGYVYLLKSGSHYKIGKSDDIEKRVKSIVVSLPEKAELVHSIRTDDPSGIELYWHRRFAEKRANGEWFALSTSDVAAFKKRKFQ